MSLFSKIANSKPNVILKNKIMIVQTMERISASKNIESCVSST